MRSLTLTATSRLLGVVLALVCLVAVAMGRLAPVPARFRIAVRPAYEIVSGPLIDPVPGNPRVLDLRTGELGRFRVPQGDAIDFASVSPWHDEDGESQVVGRWVPRSDVVHSTEPAVIGLARYSVPSGRVLDHVSLRVFPASDPCWFPGLTSRILYAGADGLLYRMDFRDAPGVHDDGAATHPATIDWHGPALGLPTVRDPVWPAGRCLDGRLIVSLAHLEHQADSHLTPARLWWLRLDHDGSAVVEAGPLTDPGAGPRADRGDERFPTVSVAPDGRILLAYLRQVPASNKWELRLSAVGRDPRTGHPVIRTADDQVLTRDHLGSRPSFSADGRAVFGILPGRPGRPGRQGPRLGPRVERYPVVPPTRTAMHPG